MKDFDAENGFFDKHKEREKNVDGSLRDDDDDDATTMRSDSFLLCVYYPCYLSIHLFIYSSIHLHIYIAAQVAIVL